MRRKRFILRRSARCWLLRASVRAVDVIAHGAGRTVIWCLKIIVSRIISVLTLARRQLLASTRGQPSGRGAKATAAPAESQVSAEVAEARQLAVEVLVAWGDRRGEASRWVAEVVKRNPAMTDPAELVRAAYCVRSGRFPRRRHIRMTP